MKDQINISEALQQSRNAFNLYLENNFIPALKKNYEPANSSIQSSAFTFAGILEYALVAPGKRLRPYLVELGFNAGGGSEDNLNSIRNLQLAVESLHTYSLIHDDLPALDNDSLRRGRKTTHIVYGEANALLAGDSLNSLALFLLSRLENVSANYLKFIFELFHNAINLNGMISGQFADLFAEKSDVQIENQSIDDLEYIHFRKTGALICASFLLGYTLARFQKIGDSFFATKQNGNDTDIFNIQRNKNLVLPTINLAEEIKPELLQWEDWFLKLGLLFQIRDDLLDEESENSKLGKSSGKDKQAGKLTFATYYGKEKCHQVQSDLAEELKEIKIFQSIQENKAMTGLERTFTALVNYIIERKY